MFQWLKNIYWRIQQPIIEMLLTYQKARTEVMQSPLWDENYYFIQYRSDIINSGLLPIDHFLQQGWSLGYNPSPYFDLKDYQSRFNIHINPFVHYLTQGRFLGYFGFNNNPYEISNQLIEQYWNEQKKRQSSKVVYTCITNDYDNLYQIRSHFYVNPEWDYICFTDNKDLIQQKVCGIWQTRPLQFTELNNTCNNRYHKFFPHIILPQYEESIYIDANINILTSYLFDIIEKRNQDFLIPIHFTNRDLYKEASIVKKYGYVIGRLDEQLKIFHQDGFPENYPLSENNIIYRRHNNIVIPKMMAQWWTWVSNYCQRDQCSLSYVLWKNNIDVSNHFINNSRIDYKNFCVFLHHPKGGTK